jgi:branched-chain amino acid transport system ATP-binding protein
MNGVLTLESISKSFGGVAAVKDVSLGVNQGELLGVIGPNGSGKTTIFNIISGFVKPDGGKVFLGASDVTSFASYKRAEIGIGRLFQDARVFNGLTVLENMLLAQQDKHEESLLTALLKSSWLSKRRTEELAKARYWLEFVGLTMKENSPALSLSYGQGKLLALAMLLVRDSKVLLLDEPISGLDVRMRQSILSLVKRLKTLGKAIVIIEHSLDFVFDVSDRIIIFKDGGKFHEGLPEETRHATPLLREVYLNSSHAKVS